ncbi:MAG: hypothetical protein ACI4J7_02435 [Ruminiclostridium sp.]
MRKTKALSALLAAVMCLSGCGAKTETTTAKPETQQTEAAVTTENAENGAEANTAEATTEATTTPVSETNSSSLSFDVVEEVKTDEAENDLVSLEIEPVHIPKKYLKEIVDSEGSVIPTLLQPFNFILNYTEIGILFEIADLSAPDPYSNFIFAPGEWCGAFAPYIVKSINEYSSVHRETLMFIDGLIPFEAVDLTDSSPEDLYKYIDNGVPVAVLVTSKLEEPSVFMENGDIVLLEPNEWVILVGYSDTMLRVWSPFSDNFVTCDRELFEQRYAEMGSQAFTVVAK